MSDASDTHGRLIAASKVTGSNVYNLAGEKIGSIYDVMLSKHSGHAVFAIMSFGGFLGMGKDYHPLPWDVLTYSPEHDGYVVNLDTSLLPAGPTLTVEQMAGDVWIEPTYGRTIRRYYIR
jgi:sporulation protein YlmC with PRC-barrel domain